MSTATATSPGQQAGHTTIPKNFSPLVKQFLDYLNLEKHFSDYTSRAYGADLIQFGQFLCGEIGQQSPEPRLNVTFPETVDDKQINCTPLTVREFLAYLYAQNYTKSTTARKLATLRSFYKFLIKRGSVQASPMVTIRTPKQEKRLPKCRSEEHTSELQSPMYLV